MAILLAGTMETIGGIGIRIVTTGTAGVLGMPMEMRGTMGGTTGIMDATIGTMGGTLVGIIRMLGTMDGIITGGKATKYGDLINLWRDHRLENQ